MKNILFILIFGLLLCCGCSGDSGVYTIELKDFIGDWYLSGTLDLDLDGRAYTQDVFSTIYIREGFVTDELGTNYIASFSGQVLTLTRDNEFKGTDPYCGFYDGGTKISFVFPQINPFFNQAYGGTVSANTAIYTQYCNYKPMLITGDVFMQRF